MKKTLSGLKWTPMWVSHLGCLKGCLDFLNVEVSDPWLFGATGHAFILNIAEDVCPSGPTAWRTEMLHTLGNNIGFTVEGIVAFKSQPDFKAKQQQAWEQTRRAIDEGLPCYGWELVVPEYYVIQGYDDRGYYVSGPGCDEGKGPQDWSAVGQTGIGVLEMHFVYPSAPADAVTTVKEALNFAVEHAQSPEKWILPKYKAGPAGYGLWIKALEGGTANGFGMAYNAAVWNECRQLAVDFLKEAKERLSGAASELFDEAIDLYGQVAGQWKIVAETLPFRGPDAEYPLDDAGKRRLLDALRTALAAEEKGLAVLTAIAHRI